MQASDRQAFLRLAAMHNACIVVREGFPEGLAKSGSPDTKPRLAGLDLPIAQTDQGNYQVAGLAVDPSVHPGVFRQRRRRVREDALKRLIRSQGAEDMASLNKLHEQGRTPWAINADAKSPRYGGVIHDGRYLHDVHEVVTAVGAGQPGHGMMLTSLIVQSLGPSRAVGASPKVSMAEDEYSAFIGRGEQAIEVVLQSAQEVERVLAVCADRASRLWTWLADSATKQFGGLRFADFVAAARGGNAVGR